MIINLTAQEEELLAASQEFQEFYHLTDEIVLQEIRTEWGQSCIDWAKVNEWKTRDTIQAILGIF